jgi:hypothetical protein
MPRLLESDPESSAPEDEHDFSDPYASLKLLNGCVVRVCTRCAIGEHVAQHYPSCPAARETWGGRLGLEKRIASFTKALQSTDGRRN